MEEIWKDVIGYEGIYKVDVTGKVKTIPRKVRWGTEGKGIKTTKEILLKPYIGKDGYWYYLLTKNNKHTHLSVHRIIAIHFIPNPENKREVNHIDLNKVNNRIENLEWTTPKENIQHSIRMGSNTQCLPGINNPAAKLTNEQVLEIRRASGTQERIALGYNISRSCVGLIKRRERWAHI